MNEVAVEKFHDSRKFGKNGSFAAAEVVQTAGQLLHTISCALIWFSCTKFPIEKIVFRAAFWTQK
jgi:hypothetical protein